MAAKAKTQADPDRLAALHEVLAADLPSLDGYEDVRRLFGSGCDSAPALSSSGAVLAVKLMRRQQPEIWEGKPRTWRFALMPAPRLGDQFRKGPPGTNSSVFHMPYHT